MEKVKNVLSIDVVLVYFDDCLFLLFECDVFFVGIGVVLLYRFFDGVERSVVYVFRGLLFVEKNYF